jgi:5-methylcytosine-specific restriction endonuclease McrA
MTNDTFESFKKWLHACGATVVPNVRSCEKLRFTHGKAKGIIVVNKKGEYKPSETATRYIEMFENAAALPRADRATSKNARKREARIQKLVQRDGRNCFYCDEPLGTEFSIEHLVPKCHNGPEHFSNLCLAHKGCNVAAGDLPVVKKVHLREESQRKRLRAT